MRVFYITCKVTDASDRVFQIKDGTEPCPLCGGDLAKFGTHVMTEMEV